MNPMEINLCLRRGAVLYAVARHVASPKPHYLIVLNNRPYERAGIVVSIVTSKIENRIKRAARLGSPETTIVMLPSGCHPCLSKNSAVDCNEVAAIPFSDLRSFTSGNFKSPDLSEEFLQRIIQGVLDSPKVQPHIKKILTG